MNAPAAKGSTEIRRPILQIGQIRGSCYVFAALPWLSGLIVGARCGTLSNMWTKFSFRSRTRLARKPKCRMRTKPDGGTLQQKPADELDCIQCHGFGPVAVRIVLPIEADAPIFERLQPVVGNSHTVRVARVAGQILEDWCTHLARCLQDAVRPSRTQFDFVSLPHRFFADADFEAKPILLDLNICVDSPLE